MTQSEKVVRDAIEFKEKCDFLLNKLHCKKSYIARLLGIKQPYLSRLYKGKSPITEEMLNKIIILCDEDKINLTLKKFAVQENLPLNPNPMMERIAKLEALLDQDHKEKNELMQDVAVLKKDLERVKNDSEKKIRAIVIDTIRHEIERIADRLPDRQRAAANDE